MTVNLNDLYFGGDSFDEATIKRYTAKIDKGESLPAAIIYRSAGGRYGVVDGRHRLEATRRAGETSFSAYVVDIDESEVAKLRKELNAARLGEN